MVDNTYIHTYIHTLLSNKKISIFNNNDLIGADYINTGPLFNAFNILERGTT